MFDTFQPQISSTTQTVSDTHSRNLQKQVMHSKLARLHEDVKKNLDEDHDTNPMDILFSPDSEYNNLIVNFNYTKPMNLQRKLIIKSKDANSKTITIQKPRGFQLFEDAVLSLQPNLFYIERQLEMLQILQTTLYLTMMRSSDSQNKVQKIRGTTCGQFLTQKMNLNGMS